MHRTSAAGIELEEADILLTAHQIAEMTSLSRSKVYAMIASGELPAVRAGRSVRVSMASYRQWLHDSGDTKESTTDNALVSTMVERLKKTPEE